MASMDRDVDSWNNFMQTRSFLVATDEERALKRREFQDYMAGQEWFKQMPQQEQMFHAANLYQTAPDPVRTHTLLETAGDAFMGLVKGTFSGLSGGIVEQMVGGDWTGKTLPGDIMYWVGYIVGSIPLFKGASALVGSTFKLKALADAAKGAAVGSKAWKAYQVAKVGTGVLTGGLYSAGTGATKHLVKGEIEQMPGAALQEFILGAAVGGVFEGLGVGISALRNGPSRMVQGTLASRIYQQSSKDNIDKLIAKTGKLALTKHGVTAIDDTRPGWGMDLNMQKVSLSPLELTIPMTPQDVINGFVPTAAVKGGKLAIWHAQPLQLALPHGGGANAKRFVEGIDDVVLYFDKQHGRLLRELAPKSGKLLTPGGRTISGTTLQKLQPSLRELTAVERAALLQKPSLPVEFMFAQGVGAGFKGKWKNAPLRIVKDFIAPAESVEWYMLPGIGPVRKVSEGLARTVGGGVVTLGTDAKRVAFDVVKAALEPAGVFGSGPGQIMSGGMLGAVARSVRNTYAAFKPGPVQDITFIAKLMSPVHWLGDVLGRRFEHAGYAEAGGQLRKSVNGVLNFSVLRRAEAHKMKAAFDDVNRILRTKLAKPDVFFKAWRKSIENPTQHAALLAKLKATGQTDVLAAMQRHMQLTEYMFTTANAERARAGLKPLTSRYFQEGMTYLPLSGKGNWRIANQRGASFGLEGGKVVPTGGFAGFETSGKAKKELARILKLRPDLRGQLDVTARAKLTSGLSPTSGGINQRTQQEILNMLSLAGEEPAAQTVVRAQAVHEAITNPGRAHAKFWGHFLKRDGRVQAGALDTYIESMHNYVDGYTHWMSGQHAQTTMRPVIKALEAIGETPKYVDELKDWLQTIWGKRSAQSALFDNFLQTVPIMKDLVKPFAMERWLGKTRELMALGHLITPRFHVQQFLQLGEGLAPRIHLSNVAKGYKEYYLNYAKWKPLLDKLLGPRGSQASRITGEVGQLRSAVGRKLEEVLLSASEYRNRAVSVIGTQLYAAPQVAKGLMSAQGLEDLTLSMVRKTQFNSTLLNIMPYMRNPLWRTLTMFKPFMFNNIAQVGGLFAEQGNKGLAKWATFKIITSGASAITSPLKLAGAVALYGSYKGWKDIADTMGQRWADVLHYGAPGFIGMDLSMSLSFIDVPMGDDPSKMAWDLFTGPLGRAVHSAALMGKALDNHEFTNDAQWRIALRRSSGTMRFLDSALQYFTEPDKAKHLRTLKGEYTGITNMSASQAFLKAMSFKTTTESNVLSELYRSMQQSQRYRNGQVQKAANAIEAGDIQEAWHTIEDYNAKFPEMELSFHGDALMRWAQLTDRLDTSLLERRITNLPLDMRERYIRELGGAIGWTPDKVNMLIEKTKFRRGRMQQQKVRSVHRAVLESSLKERLREQLESVQSGT